LEGSEQIYVEELYPRGIRIRITRLKQEKRKKKLAGGKTFQARKLSRTPPAKKEQDEAALQPTNAKKKAKEVAVKTWKRALEWNVRGACGKDF